MRTGPDLAGEGVEQADEQRLGHGVGQRPHRLPWPGPRKPSRRATGSGGGRGRSGALPWAPTPSGGPASGRGGVRRCRTPRRGRRDGRPPPRPQRLPTFLNASASSEVADFGFLGRGRCNDQPSAFSASQPRWGRTRSSPRWAAITSATLRHDHSPRSGGGSASRSRTASSTSGVNRLGLRPLRRRPLAKAPGPDVFVALQQLLDPARAEGRHLRRPSHRMALRQKPDRLHVTRLHRIGAALKRCSRSEMLR